MSRLGRVVGAIDGAHAGVLLLRGYLGVTFVYAGAQKLSDPHFLASGGPGSLHDTMGALAGVGPLGGTVSDLASHAVLIGWIVAVAELSIGIAALAGLAGRLAAGCGALLVIGFWLTINWSIKPFYQNPDPAYAAAWGALLLTGTGPLSVDRWRTEFDLRDDAGAAVSGPSALRRLAEFAGFVEEDIDAPMSRRSALRSFAAVAGLAAATALAAAASRFARASGVSAAAKGGGQVTRLPLDSVPVGGALVVGRHSNAPVWVVRPSERDLVAYSGICTHANCRVEFYAPRFELDCPCHGSRFDARTGAVVVGPATRPLPRVPLALSGSVLLIG